LEFFFQLTLFLLRFQDLSQGFIHGSEEGLVKRVRGTISAHIVAICLAQQEHSDRQLDNTQCAGTLLDAPLIHKVPQHLQQ
jgi:hypothetical protein